MPRHAPNRTRRDDRANNTTYDFRIYFVYQTHGGGCCLVLYAYGSVTLGDVATPTGTAASNTARMADTVSVTIASGTTTPKGGGALAETSASSGGTFVRGMAGAKAFLNRVRNEPSYLHSDRA